MNLPCSTRVRNSSRQQHHQATLRSLARLESWANANCNKCACLVTYESRRVIVTSGLGITESFQHWHGLEHHCLDIGLTVGTSSQELKNQLGTLGLTSSGLTTNNAETTRSLSSQSHLTTHRLIRSLTHLTSTD
jgi:hypothetical protein